MALNLWKALSRVDTVQVAVHYLKCLVLYMPLHSSKMVIVEKGEKVG